MKANNWTGENEGKNELKDNQAVKESTNFYGRTYNEAVPFTQVNFQTFQNILDQRNQLLNDVKSNNNIL